MRKLPVLILIAAASLSAQSPQPSAAFAGTWTMDKANTKATANAGLFGLGAAGLPGVLHITEAANGTVVVESQINESHARLYRPGAKSTTPNGEAGTVSVTAQRTRGVLSAEGTVESASGGAAIGVKETYTLASDGQRLTIVVAASSGGAVTESHLVFTRLSSVGSCKSWPTPCKF